LTTTYSSHAETDGIDTTLLKMMVLTCHSLAVFKQTILTTSISSHAKADGFDHNPFQIC
jgi:hypothetical protein